MWLERMYLFKQDTFRDGVIDATEIDQWRQILNEYEDSLKKILYQKTKRKQTLKNSRTNKSITTTEEMININPPPYQCNTKNNHSILNILKHETGINVNFHLWKP